MPSPLIGMLATASVVAFTMAPGAANHASARSEYGKPTSRVTLRHANRPTPTHRVTDGPFSMTVPDSWRVGHQIKLQTNLAVSQYGSALLPSLGPTSGPSVVPTPLAKTHYFSAEIDDSPGHQVMCQVFELTDKGYDEALSVTVPASQRDQLLAAIKTLKSPPVATPTDIVHFMQSHARAVHKYLAFADDQLNARDRWIVIGGNPATAQEEFALFRTIDGGHSWTLADYTTFTGSHNFLGVVGAPALHFWNANDGIVAEASAFGQTIEIQYTTDGGVQWTNADVPEVGEPSGSAAPVITRKANGTLDVTAVIYPKKSVTVQSTNNGRTWVRIANPAGVAN
ncbi:MAG: hypothetical protein C7B45_00875 [Sulfobacillus acidophilus]|uniref:Oxidoreductase n=1 Tax=Sulfobacillus acidophilus TaxID=53633 RepID=A0A2T2WNT9_9FIRM|nr:MAG: hypothetical protein C7B45_00875 [Sulfobacillus acidophilus]